MSTITKCRRCGGNIVEPSYPGDGAWPVPPVCTCVDPLPPARRCAVCGGLWGSGITHVLCTEAYP